MKAFLFNSTREWDEEHGACVVADTEKEAISIYRIKVSKDTKVEIEQIEIEKGTVLKAQGYDRAELIKL